MFLFFSFNGLNSRVNDLTISGVLQYYNYNIYNIIYVSYIPLLHLTGDLPFMPNNAWARRILPRANGNIYYNKIITYSTNSFRGKRRRGTDQRKLVCIVLDVYRYIYYNNAHRSSGANNFRIWIKTCSRFYVQVYHCHLYCSNFFLCRK